MQANAAATEFKTAALHATAEVHVVGEKSLTAELLVDFLNGKIEFACRCSPADSLKAALNQFPERSQVAFFDSGGLHKTTLFKLPEAMKTLHHPRFYPILYNVEPTHVVEMDALKRGIRGILYRNQPLEFFPQAARAVLDGELWYSRKILSRFILENNNRPAPAEETCVILTQREREIAAKLADGCSNREIARHFHISPHTVRVHVYNIYKKIKVTNRLQASKWLAANN